MKRLILITITSLFMMITLSHANYHYVSHTGSNEYPYSSWETAADSIQKAIDATAPHDTVYIGSGEWWETVAVQDFDSISIIGMGIDSTFCHSDSIGTTIMTIDYGCLVSGITFQHHHDFTCLEARYAADTKVYNCRFVKSGAGFINDGDTELSNCIFDSCNLGLAVPLFRGSYHIFNNIFENTIGSGGMAIMLQVDSALIENNIFLNDFQSYSGITMIEGAPESTVVIRNNVGIFGEFGFDVPAHKYNNTIKGYSSSWPRTQGMAVGEGDSMVNNLLYNCQYGVILAQSGSHINYNDFWNNQNDIGIWDSSSFDSLGNIFAYPMVVDEANYDFHLQAYSPLIDAGDPNILDVDGSRSDIGCYGGPGGCSYVYLDLAPLIPDSISGSVDSSNIISLIWKRNYEADFNRYQVFRDTFPGFLPSVFNMIAEPETSFYQDSLMSPSYYYRLTSVDNQGNVSDYSEEVAVRPVGIRGFDLGDNLPRYSVITNAYPNPFNSQITIVYSASNLGPQPPEIKLMIYDIQGRVVRTLVDERKPMGTYRVVWNGRDDKGVHVASGSYIARVSQWGMSTDVPVKISLIK